MGLDMFLFKSPAHKRFVSQDDMLDFDPIEIGYWRKANQIFQWIETHVVEDELQNCTYYTLSKYDIEDLKDICSIILEKHQSNDCPIDFLEKNLPAREGFFFGPTVYDDYYFTQVEHTIEICEKALDTTDWDTEEVAFWAWW